MRHIRVRIPRPLSWCTLLVLLVAALAPSAGLAQGPTGTGTLLGRVTSQDGVAIPGAVAQLTAGPVERSAVTDATGIFRIGNLPPGSYTVRVSYVGHRPGVRENVRVEQGAVVRVVIALAVAAVELEEIEVVASPLRIQKTNTDFGITIDPQVIQRLPQMASPKDMVALTPGARVGQVWGGSNQQANNYQIDGLAANHPGLGGDIVSPSVNWIETVEVKGLGAGAEHGNFQGGLINITTKSGSNDFQGALRSNFSPGVLNGSNLNETDIGAEIENRYDLEGEVRGPILKDRLFYFLAGQVIREDMRYLDHVTPNLPDSGLVFSPANEERREMKLFGKLTFLPTKKDEVNLSAGYVDLVEDYTNWGVRMAGRKAGSGMASRTGYEGREATLRHEAPTLFYSGAWQRTLGGSHIVEAKLAGFTRDETRDPYNGVDTPGLLNFGHVAPFAAHNNAAFRYRHQPTSHSGSLLWRGEVQAFGMQHSFKIGGEHNVGSWFDERKRNGDMTWRGVRRGKSYDPQNPSTWRFAGFIPVEVGGEVHLDADVQNSGLFFQDNIRISKHLLLNPGVRFGWWKGWIDPEGEAGRFLAVEDRAWEPRLGAVIDPTGNGTFVMKLHFGRYHQNMLAQLFDRVQGGNVFTNEQLWNYHGPDFADPSTTFSPAEWERMVADGDLRFIQEIRLNEMGPVVDYKQPFVDQWVAGVEKNLGSTWKVEAVYINRINKQMVGLVDRNRDTNYHRYSKVRVGQVSGGGIGRPVTFTPFEFDGRALVFDELAIPHDIILAQIRRDVEVGGCFPSCIPPGFTAADTLWLKDAWNPDYALTNLPDARREFQQMQLIFKTDQESWGGTVSVVWTSLEGNMDSVTGYDDPAGFGAGPYVRVNEAMNGWGPLDNSGDWEFKASTWVDMPAGFRGGAFVTHARGDYYSPVYTINTLQHDFFASEGPLQRNLVSPLVGHRIYVDGRGAKQYLQTYSVDTRLEKEFALGATNWMITLDAMNIFNLSTINEYNTRVNQGFQPKFIKVPDPHAYYRSVLQRVPPRTIRLGLTARF